MADTTVNTGVTGQPIRVLTALGAGSGDQQVLTLADQYGNLAARPFGPLKVSQEEHTLFLDTHDQALDTVNRWVTPTGANTPAVSSSVLTFGVATTASAFGKLTSQPSFLPLIPGFLQPSFAIKLDPSGAAAINGHRFWGVGISPTTPATTSAATKLTDAIGWEIDTDGKLYGVVYAAGVRTAIDMSATGTGAAAGVQPLDGGYHRYLMQIRTDRIYWFIDGLSFYVATMSFTTPATQTLPILIQTINPAASVAAGGYPLRVQGSVVADTASNSSQVSDGTYPWRKVRVGPNGNQAINGGIFPQVTGTITAASSSSTTGIVSTTGLVIAPVAEAGNISVTLIGAAVAATVYFEVCMDATGTNWFTVYGQPLGSLGSQPGGPAVNAVLTATLPTALMFLFPGAQFTFFRVRCSTFASGSLSVVIAAGGLDHNPIVNAIPSNANNSFPSTVAASASSVQLMGSDPYRRAGMIYNESTAIMYLLLASSAATTSNYTVQVPPNGYYELPGPNVYSGIINAIWSSAVGNARVTEMT